MAINKPTDYISSDRPIHLLREDLLSRAPFAQALARVLSSWQERDSLVIALYGKWGSGKSSIKNMALDGLAEAAKTDPHAPIIVEFNPWEFSNRGELQAAFFREVGASLGKKDRGAEYKALAKSFRKYGIYLTSGSTLASSLRKPLSGLLFVASILAFLGAGLTPFVLKAVYIVIGAILLGLGAALGLGRRSKPGAWRGLPGGSRRKHQDRRGSEARARAAVTQSAAPCACRNGRHRPTNN